MESDRPPHVKAKLTEVNSYLTCPLCKGYYIDATTIVECLHSFCRSCIIQHLQQDNYCPICELMINTAKPNIKPDKTLQDIVYKLVPGLYASEMARRRRFWAERPIEAAKVACPEARGLMTERIIFSPQDAISLSIEYTSDEPTAWARSEPDPEVPLRRYLQCPAMLRVEHLKKFICNKYNVDSQLYHVDILYKRLPLPDHYTLMDIAYIYSWKRNEPMKFFFRITDIALVSERFDYFEPSSTHSTPISRCQQQPRTPKQHIIINNNNIEKKQSPVRQPAEKKDLTSDVIKSCDSEIKQTKQGKVTSDEKQKRDKKLNKDVDSDENICKTKCVKPTDEKEGISEKIGDKVKQISENSVAKEIGIVCDVKVEKGETLKNTIDPSKKTILRTPDTKLEDDLKVPINIKTENPKLNFESSSEIPTKIKSESIMTELSEDTKKSQFLMSIQLTPKNSSSPPVIKNSSPPPLKSINFDLYHPKTQPQKRKYNRKSEKLPPFKKQKLVNNEYNEIRKATKVRKNNTKDPKISEGDSGVKVKNIKDPYVRLMVSNLNQQATNLTKIVGQTEIIDNQNDQLQSLIDSCKLNIPSSLSITLTESPRNEDGTIVPSKPSIMKPVQNYIEILKLPDKNVPEALSEDVADNKNSDNSLNKNVPNSIIRNNQKHTFQTMFEETIKKNESLKAELYKIQNQAKTMELVKKTVNTTKLNIPKTVKKQQNNALDLSISSPALETSSPISTNLTNGNFCSKNMALENGHQIATTPISNGTNSNGKRNILEIAHQLSKRSRIELDTLKVPNNLSPSSVTSPKCSPIASENNSPKIKDPEPISSSPPQQKIIINSNFSSGGSISIKRSPKKISVPRLPIAKVPMPKLHPPNIKNGKLLKFSNYTAKLANNSNNIKFIKSPAKSPTNLPKPENNIINGLTPNQLLEKYNITNLAQFNANLNQAQLAFQQALMVSHQLELHRMQQNSQKHWMSNPNILAHYENYVQSLKNQQNQIVGNSSKN